MPLRFDTFLRYDELTAALHELASAHPAIVTVESYGRSHEGRDLWLVTLTDSSAGPAEGKPAFWVDANIHATEVTGGVAALYLLHHLTHGAVSGDPAVVEALRTRTFYVVPRVNPDGVELALADRPRYLRSSARPWPYADAWMRPGLHSEDVDGDGRVLSMRVPDANGAWTPSADDPRLMVPVGPQGAPAGQERYRLLEEGTVADYDGFTVPTPRDRAGLDLNRNFPAGWGTGVAGSGDHPLSEPEIDALVRAIRARPNICGYNAYHTSGGVLLRPSSTQADSSLPPVDLWTWGELGRLGTELTGYRTHSVFEDFTWDKSFTMSGAADDWAYEHLGVYSWTTEFWDVVFAATGERAATDIWYLGPTPEQELAVLRWADRTAPGAFVDWYHFDHPQLGPVELGGWNWFRVWSNPPAALLEAEVAPHARFAVAHALASPRLEVITAETIALGAGGKGQHVRLTVGIANTGWLPTFVTERARKNHLVLPVTAEVKGAEVVGGPARVELGQLEGRSALRRNGWALSDGTADRALVTWTLRAAPGTELTVTVRHQRAGVAVANLTVPG